MSAPDFLICLECESPCYVFEWKEDKVTEALCQVCGSDEVDEFATPEDFDAMVNAPSHRPSRPGAAPSVRGGPDYIRR